LWSSSIIIACLLSPSVFSPSHRSVARYLVQENIMPSLVTKIMSSEEATIFPAASHLASVSGRPAPGSFKFMPQGTKIIWCSSETPGSPWTQPVLVLPSEDQDSDIVRVLLCTTKDVVRNCKADTWGRNYVPLEGHSHPWRKAIPLTQGCFRKGTSLNVTTEYKVRWRDLEDVNSRSSDRHDLCLSAETLSKVSAYVNAPYADRPAPFVSRSPVRLSPPVAVPAPVPTQGTARKSVPPQRRQSNGMNRALSPTAAEFKPHPAHSEVSWR
jgi:hypothetical protein